MGKRDGIYGGQIKPSHLNNPPRLTIPKEDQKYRGLINKTWTTQDTEFGNKRQLKALATPAQESKLGDLN